MQRRRLWAVGPACFTLLALLVPLSLVIFSGSPPVPPSTPPVPAPVERDNCDLLCCGRPEPLRVPDFAFRLGPPRA